MKKLTLICTGVVLVLLCSCKKDYTCVCDKKVTATGAALPTTTVSIHDATAKRAKEMCPFTFDVPADETWNCTLK